jgi:hypothetical protein
MIQAKFEIEVADVLEKHSVPFCVLLFREGNSLAGVALGNGSNDAVAHVILEEVMNHCRDSQSRMSEEVNRRIKLEEAYEQ